VCSRGVSVGIVGTGLLAVDGTEPQELRKIMELELDNKEEQEEKIPQLFESAGGFSPTIGSSGRCSV
jgi:chemotaxis protein MotA